MGDEEDDSEAVVLTELLTAVMSGNTKSLANLVDRVREGELALKSGKKEPAVQLVNTQFGSSKASCLHLAAKEGHRLVGFFVLARSQVNLLKYLTVEYYFPTNTLSIK